MWPQQYRSDPFGHLHDELVYLQPALRRVAEFILKEPERLRDIRIQDMAATCNVAESTVTRFVKEMGANSFRELKTGIVEALCSVDMAYVSAGERGLYEDVAEGDSSECIAEKILRRSIRTVTETKRGLNLFALEKAAEAIARARILLFCCTGDAGAAAEEAALLFTKAGKHCLLFGEQGMQLSAAAAAGGEDAVMALSNSGQSEPVVRALRLAQRAGAVTMGITSFENTPMARYCDILLFTAAKAPRATSSAATDAQLFVVDALYACFTARYAGGH